MPTPRSKVNFGDLTANPKKTSKKKVDRSKPGKTIEDVVLSYEQFTTGPVHLGRSWSGTALEDECPCPKAPCGLVASNAINQDCPQHGIKAAKTIRQSHAAHECPAFAPEVVRTSKHGCDKKRCCQRCNRHVMPHTGCILR